MYMLSGDLMRLKSLSGYSSLEKMILPLSTAIRKFPSATMTSLLVFSLYKFCLGNRIVEVSVVQCSYHVLKDTVSMHVPCSSQLSVPTCPNVSWVLVVHVLWIYPLDLCNPLSLLSLLTNLWIPVIVFISCKRSYFSEAWELHIPICKRLGIQRTIRDSIG